MQPSEQKLTHRQLKRIVFELLQLPDLRRSVEQISRFPFRQVVNPLFSFLYSLDEPIKWRAVSVMGAVIARSAEENMESARIVMRRFIWNLNDESGGIGWGSPESMGEAMALNLSLADQYASILLSYINPDGNYLEHEDLQPGVLWGIGRLAHARPGHAQGCAPLSATLFGIGQTGSARYGRLDRRRAAIRPTRFLSCIPLKTTPHISSYIRKASWKRCAFAIWLRNWSSGRIKNVSFVDGS